MRTLTDQLANYAAYHRDRRNIATHFIGVPMIVFAVEILLSKPVVMIGGWALTPAWLGVALAALFYLRMSISYGLAMTMLLVLGAWAAAQVAALGTAVWLAAGIGLFVVGWAIQILGHHYEGRRPAFVDDVVGLLIGPLFIVVEAAFALGLSRELQRAIEVRVGVTRGGGSTATA
jgi:uncharacterized membrane protein YGL010W